jgi:hypothetical protein
MREDMQKRGMSSPDRADTVAQASRAVVLSADPCRESRRRKHDRGLDEQGLVIAEAARWNTT